MKIFFVLFSSLALVSTALAEPPENPHKGKKKAAQIMQGRAQKGGSGLHAGPGGGMQPISRNASTARFHNRAVTRSQVTKFQSRKFTFTGKANAKIANVRFHAGHVIAGSQNWHGAKYVAFKNYKAVWHDKIWWHDHHTRIVFVFGAPYYWDAGWWYPAWGYDPTVSYAYDGPIFAYNDLPPDQVVANVQAALQQQGYYTGEVDGLLWDPLESTCRHASLSIL